MSTYFLNLANIFDIYSAKRSRRSPYSYCFAINKKNTKNAHFSQIFHFLPPGGPLNFYANSYIPNLKMWAIFTIHDEVSNSPRDQIFFYEFLDLVWFGLICQKQKSFKNAFENGWDFSNENIILYFSFFFIFWSKLACLL